MLYSRESAGETATPQEVAAMLVAMKLEEGGIVQMKNCFSAAGANYEGNDWLERFDNGTLMEACDPEESLAAAVEESLRNDYGKSVEVHGYLTAVTMHSQSVRLKDEDRKAHHFGGVRGLSFHSLTSAMPRGRHRTPHDDGIEMSGRRVSPCVITAILACLFQRAGQGISDPQKTQGLQVFHL